MAKDGRTGHQVSRRWMAAKIMPFPADVGIVGGPSKALHRGRS